MGLSDGLTSSPQEYIATAVAIAMDADRRAALGAAILERRHLIERNREVFDAYSDLFRHMATGQALPLAEPVQAR
jgi:predicted O-linked N-acetylglucosamine transferase (SPINDLY family)